MKIYLKIITVSIISTLILFEIYLRFNKEILYNLKNLLPDTNVTKNIKNEIVNKSKSKRKIYSINDLAELGIKPETISLLVFKVDSLNFVYLIFINSS